MAKYLIIESRNPFESRDSTRIHELARALQSRGHVVTMFLVENGALAARSGAVVPEIDETVRSGVEVLVDEYALRLRGIAEERVRTGVRPAPLDVVIDHLVEGRKAIWH